MRSGASGDDSGTSNSNGASSAKRASNGNGASSASGAANANGNGVHRDARRLRNGLIWTAVLLVMLLGIGLAVPDLRGVLRRASDANFGWLALAGGLELVLPWLRGHRAARAAAWPESAKSGVSPGLR